MDWSLFWTWVGQGLLVALFLWILIPIFSVPLALGRYLISSSKNKGASSELILKGGSSE